MRRTGSRRPRRCIWPPGGGMPWWRGHFWNAAPTGACGIAAAIRHSIARSIARSPTSPNCCASGSRNRERNVSPELACSVLAAARGVLRTARLKVSLGLSKARSDFEATEPRPRGSDLRAFFRGLKLFLAVGRSGTVLAEMVLVAELLRDRLRRRIDRNVSHAIAASSSTMTAVCAASRDALAPAERSVSGHQTAGHAQRIAPFHAANDRRRYSLRSRPRFLRQSAAR